MANERDEESGAAGSGAADQAFADRVYQYLEGLTTAEQDAALNEELARGGEKRELFVKLCIIASVAREELSPEYEVLHLGGQSAAQRPTRKKTVRTVEAPQERWKRWAVAAGVMLVAGVGLALMAPWRHAPVVVATMAPVGISTGSGLGSAGAATAGTVIQGQRVTVGNGGVTLHFRGGATALIEGPGAFVAVSETEINLEAGQLTATAHGGGFVVRTPNALVRDLGTEFGVRVAGGETGLEVFTGSVQAQHVEKGEATVPVVVKAGDAARVGQRVEQAVASPQSWVRVLSAEVRELDVADLLSGGDGTSGRREGAISVATGQSGILPPVASYHGDHAFHVTEVPMVDGCFVPDGKTVIDSAGDSFTFGKTSNASYNDLWAGGALPWPKGGTPMPTVLGGVDYGGAGHDFVEIHANKGVTIDLAALRRLHPGSNPAALRAMVGNTYVKHAGVEASPRADVVVLVDGRVRYEKQRFVPEDGAFLVEVGLTEKDRFLTLVTTDGGDTERFDGVLWGDPRLVLSGAGAVR